MRQVAGQARHGIVSVIGIETPPMVKWQLVSSLIAQLPTAGVVLLVRHNNSFSSLLHKITFYSFKALTFIIKKD